MQSARLRKLFATLNQESDVVYAVFLEKGESSGKSPFEKTLDYLIEHCQPSPVMTHVELVIPPVGMEPAVFSTYLGETAQWRADADENRRFYFEQNAGKWRAVPVFGETASAVVREAAQREVSAPYSLIRYPFSTRALRGASWILPHSAGSPGHCANVTARILSSVTDLEQSNFYSPSTLYAELVERAKLVEMEGEGDAAAARRAVSGQLEDVLSRGEMIGGAKFLTDRLVEELQSGGEGVSAQKDLASLVLRWSVA
jgi:hypothetical protein